MRGVASRAMTSIEHLLNNQITKFTDFEVIYYMYRYLLLMFSAQRNSWE